MSPLENEILPGLFGLQSIQMVCLHGLSGRKKGSNGGGKGRINLRDR
jgi:hypothetical protein